MAISKPYPISKPLLWVSSGLLSGGYNVYLTVFVRLRPYLDIIKGLKDQSNLPIAAYHVGDPCFNKTHFGYVPVLNRFLEFAKSGRSFSDVG